MDTLKIRNGDGSFRYQSKIGGGLDANSSQADFSVNYLQEVMAGNVPGARIVNKFGYSVIGTTMQPVTSSGTFQTPLSDTSLEIVSDSADDAAAGTGIRTVVVEGCNLAGARVSEIISMNGLTPVPIPTSYARVFRIKALESGTYATASSPSHDSKITIRGVVGGEVWGEITSDSGFGYGQSQIAVFSTDGIETAYLLNTELSIEASKTVDLYFFRRDNYDTVVAPFGTMRLVQEYHGLSANTAQSLRVPSLKAEPFSDFGIMAKVATGTASVTASFQILLRDET